MEKNKKSSCVNALIALGVIIILPSLVSLVLWGRIAWWMVILFFVLGIPGLLFCLLGGTMDHEEDDPSWDGIDRSMSDLQAERLKNRRKTWFDGEF